jgi:hypothetical protein
MQRFLFPDDRQLERDPKREREDILSLVALPVSATELGSAFASPGEERVRPPRTYVILDCRSANSFHFARLPTAVHVGDEIGFDAELLADMRRRFESAKGSHLCILGTGRAITEEQNLIKVIALNLVQNGFPYISIAVGGFKACIPLIKAGKLEHVRSPKPQLSAPVPTPTPCTPPAESDRTEGLPTAQLTTKAAEIKAKAASWGLGLMKAIEGRFDAMKGAGADAHRSDPQSVSSGSKECTNRTGDSHPQADEPPQSKSQALAETQSQSLGQTTDSRVFSLGVGDDDDDDLGLITSISSPPRSDASPAAKSEPNSSSAVKETKAASLEREGELTEAFPHPPRSSSASGQSQPAEKHHPFDDIFV